MYRPAARPLTLVFPARALPLKDDSARGSRSETVPLLLIGAARAPHRRDARRRAAALAPAQYRHGDARGLEVSPGGLLQNELVQHQKTCLAPPAVLKKNRRYRGISRERGGTDGAHVGRQGGHDGITAWPLECASVALSRQSHLPWRISALPGTYALWAVRARCARWRLRTRQ
jgi:hypothetical protein